MNPLQYLVAWLLTLSFSNASAFSSLGSLPHTRSSFLSKPAILVRGGDLVYESTPPEPAPLDEPSVVNRSRPTPAAPTTTSSVALAVSGLGAMAEVLTNVGRSYTQQLDKYPIFTKSYTAGVVFALSDYIAQRVEKTSGGQGKKIDKTRLLASTLVGFLYFGPAAHYWYEAIFALLPGSSVWSTLQKAALGQLIFGPSFTCIFFAVSLLQAGQFSLGAWGQKIRSDLPGAWLAGVGFWPLVDFVSYSVVPVKWIPLFINLYVQNESAVPKPISDDVLTLFSSPFLFHIADVHWYGLSTFR
jgi:protein Mpv17